ncbi:DUF7344 domain-containing protein [Haladaptatus sp.]|uniref:DUF7344 domain-containing protein n=1 Tax=Haladaptatus sp. TaxID=1973141 RepID=UPI003C503CCA
MDGDEHSLRALLQILAEPRRRYALYHLRRHDRTTVTRLADSVAGWMDAEQDEPIEFPEILSDLLDVTLEFDDGAM